MRVSLSGTPAPASATGLGFMKSVGKEGGAEVDDRNGRSFSWKAAREAAPASAADAPNPDAASAKAEDDVLRRRVAEAVARRARLRMAVFLPIFSAFSAGSTSGGAAGKRV